MPPSALQRAAARGLRLADALAFLAPLLTRLTVGYTFFLTGRGKLADLAQFAGFLADQGVPFAALQAPLVAGLEAVGGICLVLGLLMAFIAAGRTKMSRRE